MSGLAKYRVTIGAGLFKKFDARGDFCYVRKVADANDVENQGEVEVTLQSVETGDKSGGRFKLDLRQDEKWYSATEFDKVELKNNSAVDIIVTLFLGYGDFAKPVPDIINVAVTTNPQGSLRSAADVDTNAAAAVAVLPAAADRSCAIITALAANDQILRVGDSLVTAARGTPLQAGETIAIRSKGAIYAIEEVAGTCKVAVLEELEG